MNVPPSSVVTGWSPPDYAALMQSLIDPQRYTGLQQRALVPELCEEEQKNAWSVLMDALRSWLEQDAAANVIPVIRNIDPGDLVPHEHLPDTYELRTDSKTAAICKYLVKATGTGLSTMQRKEPNSFLPNGDRTPHNHDLVILVVGPQRRNALKALATGGASVFEAKEASGIKDKDAAIISL